MSELPDWSGRLTNYYCVIRVEKRNKAIRRRYYRKVEKEKLRLAELGICQECIRITCRYLSVNYLKCSIKKCDYNHSQTTLF